MSAREGCVGLTTRVSVCLFMERASDNSPSALRPSSGTFPALTLGPGGWHWGSLPRNPTTARRWPRTAVLRAAGRWQGPAFAVPSLSLEGGGVFEDRGSRVSARVSVCCDGGPG